MSLAACATNRALVVGTCPKYPDPPETTLQTLADAARKDKPTEQWVIDQSKLKDQLELCGRERALGEMALRPRQF
jgi:hypothetical protein